MEDVSVSEGRKGTGLSELAGVFLKLGCISFGGPAAHLALFEDEIVTRRRWLRHEEFLDLLGAVNLIPGPNSTEMAIHVGRKQAGFPGLVVAGTCFILPAMLIVLLLSYLYVNYGSLPNLAGLLSGIKPVIIAIIVQALWRLGRKAISGRALTFTFVLASALSLAGINELAVLFGVGFGYLAFRMLEDRSLKGRLFCLFPGLPVIPAAFSLAAAAGVPYGLGSMFLFFLKVGAVLFGSGYVLLAFLRADLVERWQWLSESQLLDAVAVGQITPGPLFTTATFIGYLLGGPLAALVATAGIFLPAFFYVWVSAPFIARLRASRSTSAFLDGINAASLALMFTVSRYLAASTLVGWKPVLIALTAGGLLFSRRVNSVWLVLGGGLAGTFLF